MAIDAIIKKIDRYLKRDSIGPLVVDVQNRADLDTISTYYNLPQNTFHNVADSAFCNQDELPSIANLLDKLSKEENNFFVRGLSPFYMLQGEKALTQALTELLYATIAGHAVILTYQCAAYLQGIIKNDTRLGGRICIVPGVEASRPRLIFTAKGVGVSRKALQGIHCIAEAVESEMADTIYVETDKSRDVYPLSLYEIADMKHPYQILCNEDTLTASLDEHIGSEEDWLYVLSEFRTYSSWEKLIGATVGNVNQLDSAISNYRLHSEDNRWLWLYYVGLKLFGAGTDSCLNVAVSRSSMPSDLIRNIYRSILELDAHSADFSPAYERRKFLLNAVGNPIAEATDFCKIVQSKGQDALYYLTDNSIQEKELVFKLLDRYGLYFEKAELMGILKRVYPDLHCYLSPYRFKNDLLDTYFQDYKYQKVLNKIFPDFMSIVEQQAISRDYNMILQPRSAVIEKIDHRSAQTFFTDAMGVEFLGFIMEKCRDAGLMAKVTVCRSELPSITSRNKEFWDVLSTERYPIISFDKIDKIKHHGEEGYDYSREDKKLPIHLIRELELIETLINKIKADLIASKYGKAILISDHGASRLAVIHETENHWEMEESGQHSGRCCPKSSVDVKPESATDADDFWALANYDRFKGSRRANVEVHGGATLEEVTVPIIEITYLNSAVEVKIMPIDAPASFVGTPEILVSYRKKAAIKIYISQRLMDVSVEIDSRVYDARVIDDNFYVVDEMPEIRRAKTYYVNIFACGNKIADSLPLHVKKESGSEKSIL